MNIRSFVAAAALLTSFAGAASAQTAVQTAPASSVGQFLYDQQGDTLGSVRRLADGGRSAVIMLGFVGQPGSHEATVPASALSVADGRVVLRNETVQALNAR